jgi:plastocyanin
MMKRRPVSFIVIAIAMASVMGRADSMTTVPENQGATTAPTTAPANESRVEIDNFVFKPKELHVAAGTKVAWVNKDDVPHTATSADETPAFDSKALDTDDTYSFTFTKPGTYKYFCKVHPHMTGVVIVK